jgi:hypothetical protein
MMPSLLSDPAPSGPTVCGWLTWGDAGLRSAAPALYPRLGDIATPWLDRTPSGVFPAEMTRS